MVRSATATPSATKGRVAMIIVLYAVSVIIMLLGAGFSVYSAINNVQLQVMTSTFPG